MATSGCPIPDDETMNGLMDVAIKASRKAGDIIREHSQGVKVHKWKANSRDLLTLIDSLCQKTIQDEITQAFPSHGFIGEESVPAGKESSAAAINAMLIDEGLSDFLWIVDPIDGTTNFVHGIPLSAPSIALAYKGNVIVAAIFDPHRNELFTAMKGRGAFMNGQRIHVGCQSDLSQSIVAMGSPPADDSMKMSLQGTTALMGAVQSLRMLGSAALMLAWVANGRLTCYWEYDLSCWDIGAGVLLVMEAGGQVTDFEGNEFSIVTRRLCASNKRVHLDILRALNEAGIR